MTAIFTPPLRNERARVLYGNGMTLAEPWKQHVRVDGNVAPVTISFTSATTATMTLPNGRTTSLVRHRF